jgi:hypothetical protein
MGYWLNIHHPKTQHESRKSQCEVYLQEKSSHLVDTILKHDKVFIYETEAFSGETVISIDEDGTRKSVKLEKGAKGIIALVEIAGLFKKYKWIWNGVPYIGSFPTNEINTKKSYIELTKINRAYRSNGLKKEFNPRINSGLRKLGVKEYKVLSELMEQ